MKLVGSNRLSAGLLGAACSLSAPLVFAEIELGQGFSIVGQFDAGYRFTDEESSSSNDPQTFSTNEFQLDVNYVHSESGLYAHLELEGRTNDDTDNQFRTEAAFIGRNFSDGVGFKVGKFISPSGYEGAEPWDRFTRTTAFGGIFAYLQNGIAGYYKKGIFNIYGAIVDGAWTADNDIKDPSVELQLGITTENLVTRLTMAFEKYDADDDGDGVDDHAAQDRSMINYWAQYSVGDFTLAAEYNLLAEMNRELTTTSTAWDGDALLLFAKYQLSEQWFFGLRYSEAEYEDIDGDSVSDSSEITFTPRYQILSDGVEWDVRADFRWQDGDNEIAGIYDGFLFEIGTTLRF